MATKFNYTNYKGVRTSTTVSDAIVAFWSNQREPFMHTDNEWSCIKQDTRKSIALTELQKFINAGNFIDKFDVELSILADARVCLTDKISDIYK